ncbi:heterokaryon incompatibility protein-domain-containing protein [Boeremia exigua]|uniref:heterokaryon incompatibility protein-domain-containing protein n=1 Tax=Boeremia exigua TaxID=749465 RepID=UPI001E8E8D61|nr:heterokaryon incompatibility protein-domain-containing protein [Boeremia exigua]KAH6643063.1 heterokaryon incompatibility protein-domain-containing protein [Boeremia exigua]
MMVCATCKGLQKNLNPVDGAQDIEAGALYWVDASMPDLRTSAADCRACGLLLQGILLHHERFRNVKENDIRITAESFKPVPERSSQDHLSVEVRWQEQHSDDQEDDEHGSAGWPNLKLEFFTDGDGQSSFSAIGRGRQISSQPLQDTGLATIRNLLKSCLATHSKCRQPKSTTLPKRVLDVSGTDSKSIRLHESDFNQEESRYEYGEYIALSHIWGTAKSLPKSATRTIQSHKKGIPWTSLPRAIQEAIVLTRALGFRWLWIDAFCLIQDDVASRIEESMTMDQIFGNAFLTIAATSATDSSTQPLFPAQVQPFKIQATDNKGSAFKIYVREQPSHYSFKAPFDESAHMNDWELPFNISDRANQDTPLLKRAWAFIERLLSPRILHFTTSEMILECREGYQCECGRIADPFLDSRATDSIKQELARMIWETNRRPSFDGNVHDPMNGIESVTSQLASTTLTNRARNISQKREEALQLWSYVVTEFTARNMTYDSDRLLAIANIANQLSPALHSGYIAGQWSFSTMGLLWYPNDSTICRRSKPLPGQNIPSWSWASVEGSPIFFDTTSAMDLACRASFASSEEDIASWSPLSGQSIELSAAMATEVTFNSMVSAEGASYLLSRNGVVVDFMPDVPLARHDEPLRDGETLTCVLVSMTYRSSVIGLVLQRSNSSGMYRRVGRLECYECSGTGNDEMSEDAEALFDHWFPDIQDMSQLDNYPLQRFTVV